MSWFFSISNLSNNSTNIYANQHDSSIFSISFPGFYLALGGNPDTIFWEFDSDTSSGWAVVGIGIKSYNSKVYIMTKTDWSELLSKKIFDTKFLDGHFAIIRWKCNCIECFTDQLGLRSVYIGKFNEGVCISTRLDWVAQTTGSNQIDFFSFGSRWLMFNQTSYNSCVIGIERLGPGGHAIIDSGSIVKLQNNPWLPSFEPCLYKNAFEILKSFLFCALNYKYTLSLGLSGGIDSRLLLSFITSIPSEGFSTHTFGPLDDPDVRVARNITSTLKLTHFQFNEPLPDIESCLSSIRSFVAQNILVEPCTSWCKFRYYSKLWEQKILIIDGGFGEISRRQYFNRIVKLGGKSVLLKKDVKRLFKLMRSKRADIFSPEVSLLLENGAKNSMLETLDSMPSVENIGIENFADLLAVRTRVSNYGGPEQARLDREILNFMPLVQPSFLNAVFGIPVSMRSNAKLYYNTIRTLHPVLCKFPLVKSGITYPFGSSSTMAWLITKIKSKIFHSYSDPSPNSLLYHIREFVEDIVNSKDVVSNPIYDSRKILKSISDYYQGNQHKRNIVEWWLTFELWKQSLSLRNY